ncbi:hypothetical protein [Glaciimonas sp. PCH181]|uniref:hypothetical protein n=1 Tax=Glaciimonas sp. PCH181 TaxID=2133943 RepID=UPI000D366F13|nr:hypothetical protein [Glaciimonas sp. PCH181]PUA18821.1 hypothetical protein C7W93_02595 [Glaciimonas sp. PCH181]
MSLVRTARIAGAVMLALPLLSVAASGVDLSGYQSEDGAITLKRNVAFVDPYFSTKALLLAAQQGLNVQDMTQKWVRWLLPRQLPDGRFMRYCKTTAASDWVACQDADADDAMMAMWVALLAQTTQGEMSPEIVRSIDRSLTQLESLRVAASANNPAKGTYTISATNSVALLMDNVEIYEGYRVLSRYFTAHGPAWRGQAYAVRAQAVAEAIEAVFWDPVLKRYRITTQARQADDFYPDRVAQLFPLLGDLPDIRRDRRAAYKAWLQANKQRWLMLKADYFPWGLVAIAAKRMGDNHTALCWAANAGSLRAGPRWNVLEEVEYAVLSSHVAQSVSASSTEEIIERPIC